MGATLLLGSSNDERGTRGTMIVGLHRSSPKQQASEYQGTRSSTHPPSRFAPCDSLPSFYLHIKKAESGSPHRRRRDSRDGAPQAPLMKSTSCIGGGTS